jgi:2-oxoglutarate ferredoxin oxidoreductase subunit beta
MPARETIVAGGPPGSVETVMLHDGGQIRVRRVDADYDPTDKVAVMAYLEAHRARGEVVTGLLYVNETEQDLHAAQRTVPRPLNALSDAELVPGSAALEAVNAALR